MAMRVTMKKLSTLLQKDVKDLGDTGFTLTQPTNVTVSYIDSGTQSQDHHTQEMTLVPSTLEESDSTSLTDNTAYEDNSSHTSNTGVEKTRDEGQELAICFSSWFYNLLKSLANCTPGANPAEWGPQHFWQDAKLTVQCNEPTGLQETTVDGADLVSKKFKSMVVVDQLCFNPNISPDSVKGKQSAHGLVIVMVCGTVHRHKDCLGVFEQSFGLIRDPSEENNWKIKFSKLMLKASGSGENNRLEGPENCLEEPAQ